MRRGIAIWCLALAVISSPAFAEPPSQAAAGSTIETAIILPNIADEFHGVAAEHRYIARHFPTWHIENQALVEQNGRHYDRIGMIKPDGEHTALFFDITAWFAK